MEINFHYYVRLTDSFLQPGSYEDFDETKKLCFLTKNLPESKT